MASIVDSWWARSSRSNNRVNPTRPKVERDSSRSRLIASNVGFADAAETLDTDRMFRETFLADVATNKGAAVREAVAKATSRRIGYHGGMQEALGRTPTKGEWKAWEKGFTTGLRRWAFGSKNWI